MSYTTQHTAKALFGFLFEDQMAPITAERLTAAKARYFWRPNDTHQRQVFDQMVERFTVTHPCGTISAKQEEDSYV